MYLLINNCKEAQILLVSEQHLNSNRIDRGTISRHTSNFVRKIPKSKSQETQRIKTIILMLVLNKQSAQLTSNHISENKNQNFTKKYIVNLLAMSKKDSAALWSKWDEVQIELLKK